MNGRTYGRVDKEISGFHFQPLENEFFGRPRVYVCVCACVCVYEPAIVNESQTRDKTRHA